jgi:glycerol-3-phosphate dehydrogenase
MDAAAADHLARAYGTEALTILESIEKDASLGRRLVESQPYLWAEIPHAVGAEMALTLEDVLRRRLHLFYDVEDGGMSVAREVAERMAGEPGVGWDADRVENEVASYEEAVARTRVHPAASS